MNPNSMLESQKTEHVGPGRPLSLAVEVDTLESDLDATGQRYAIVASLFNSALVDRLVEGAVDCLIAHGVRAADLSLIRVPGAWELPLALEELAVAGGWDGLVALGIVIRGETAHFDYICTEASRGTAQVSERHRLPIGFGLLTCETTEQAVARCGGEVGNKGQEAAEAAIAMANLIARLRESGRSGSSG